MKFKATAARCVISPERIEFHHSAFTSAPWTANCTGMNHLRIGLMVDTLGGYGTKILAGISRYARQQPNWRVAYFDRERGELAKLVGTFAGDGIICTAVDDSFAEAAKGRDLPILNVTGRGNHPAFIHVVADDHACGVMAATYLLDRGFQNFGFVKGAASFATERTRGFVETIEAAGFSAKVHTAEEGHDAQLRQWIAGLPRPLALASSGDRHASMANEACWQLNLRVPEEVAILGIGNHEQLCELSNPTLSSLEVDMERRGYEAAQLLDRILAGEPAPERPLLIPPVSVVERRSTSFFAFDDLEVAAALRFIRDNAGRTIHVRDVVAATKISRRSLEGRFTKLIGRSMHDEIWAAHFDLATRLLSSSDLRLKEVAERSGFRTASALVNLFQARMGLTPKDYRIRNRR